MILKIEIELGNGGAMNLWRHVRAALTEAFLPGMLLRYSATSLATPTRNDAGRIFDANGVTVGDWRVCE